MQGLKKSWNHFCTITYHKILVARYCFKVGLYKQGLLHDMSKYSPTEFKVGIQYYQGDRSPNTAERADKGYSTAWLHHKGRNKHHYEYWLDFKNNGDATFEGKPMPTRYVVEMFCDRIAASRVYMGDKYTDSSPLEYLQREKDTGAILIHNESIRLLERMLTYLAENGESKTLYVIKKYVVKARWTEGEATFFSD